MTPRYPMSILDEAAARHDWATRDPHSIALPLKGRSHEPKCCCPTNHKRTSLGGCKPMIDLKAEVLRCRNCTKVIGSNRKTKQVSWLRSLLEVYLDKPEHFDEESIKELIWHG